MFIISLGGLSESGKSSVGLYLSKLGFYRVKIVSIEKEMMIERGILSEVDMVNEAHFDELYKNSREACHIFIQKLKAKMIARKKVYASIESIYRPELHLALREEFKENYQCIYFEAPIEKRIERELYRLKCEENLQELNYDIVELIVKRKDNFKVKHQANLIREIADYVIDNSETKVELFQKIDVILKEHEIEKSNILFE